MKAVPVALSWLRLPTFNLMMKRLSSEVLSSIVCTSKCRHTERIDSTKTSAHTCEQLANQNITSQTLRNCSLALSSQGAGTGLRCVLDAVQNHEALIAKRLGSRGPLKSPDTVTIFVLYVSLPGPYQEPRVWS